jgi:hypothetical protein
MSREMENRLRKIEAVKCPDKTVIELHMWCPNNIAPKYDGGRVKIIALEAPLFLERRRG